MPREPLRDDVPAFFRRLIAGVRPVMQVVTRRDWSGGEHLPQQGGFVLAANHVSYADPFALGHFLVDHGRAPRFLAKANLLEVPVLSTVITHTGQIPVHRNTPRASDAFSEAVAAVRAGACVVVLPEGTLTRDPQLWPMTGKSGAARIALETGCPLVPAAIWGTQGLLWPYRGRVPKVLPRKTMHIRVGAPVDLSDLPPPYDPATLRVASDRVMDAITSELEHLRGEPAPAQRIDFHGYDTPKPTTEDGEP